MKTVKPSSAIKSGGLSAPLLLLVVLACLFWRSFLPDYVQFSNDGPLGDQNAAWAHLPSAFTGVWDDLNSIGINNGAWSVDLSILTRWLLGPVGFAKFYVPIALYILGLGALAFFRALKLSPLAATLGALAAMLNSDFFSDACWGVASHEIAFGMDFFALALIVSNSPETPALVRWTRLALAGLAVGINVMEAADIGAIFSLLVAAFVFYKALTEENISILKKFSRGTARVAIVAIFAGFIALQAVSSLVSTNIQGIAGTQQDAATKAAHWGFATQWSFPKVETLGIIVPGLFGYRMDTPKDMMPALQDAYQGGLYWGAIGRGVGAMRFCGGGYYAGVLVILIAFWAMVQSFRKQQNSIFPKSHRHSLWFWTALLIVSLLLSWGKFAPFYALLYKLPYFSVIRDPTKFLYVFSWALVVIFAYGVHGLSRRYLEVAATRSTSWFVQLKTWWTKIRGFDRDWTSACIVALAGSLLAWLIYGSEKSDLVKFLQTVGFPDEDTAKQIAAFSIASVGWFILFFALAIGLLMLVLAGVFSGRRAKWGGIFFGALLIVDLGRADLPWIIHWNYIQKYDIDPANPANSTNPLLNLLREKSYEHRVTMLPFRSPGHLPFYDDYFADVYRIEWAQHQFPYYNIQSLGIIQMSRTPVDLETYETALAFLNSPETAYLLTRKWQLTNTRYLLGPAGFLAILNEQLDPVKQRFRIAQRFDIVAKPGVAQLTGLEELTAATNDDGELALFNFTGALPRAKLYANWQASTNDAVTLKTLVATNFDPAKIVLVSTDLPPPLPANATNENAGTVTFKSYAPKDIVLDADASAPSVLLLNDKYDSDWHVTVDGKPAQLLRCNFIMRGVYLTPGAHTVEFQFKLPNGPLYVTLTAWAIGILLLVLLGLLIFLKRKSNATVRA
ncbi:MAG: hypothetical protein ACREDS_01165 [Limisphaerales bacterium]